MQTQKSNIGRAKTNISVQFRFPALYCLSFALSPFLKIVCIIQHRRKNLANLLTSFAAIIKTTKRVLLQRNNSVGGGINSFQRKLHRWFSQPSNLYANI